MSDEKQYRIYVCGGPHCSAAGREALVRALEDELWAHRLDEIVEVRVSGCQSRCECGPNATLWPGPYHYTRLTPEAVRRIVAQHLRGGVPAAELLHNFR
jgi:(2Fe-2S) ferredoxin